MFAVGARAVLDEQEAFECIIHGNINCLWCFNWVAIIEKEAHTFRPNVTSQ